VAPVDRTSAAAFWKRVWVGIGGNLETHEKMLATAAAKQIQEPKRISSTTTQLSGIWLGILAIGAPERWLVSFN